MPFTIQMIINIAMVLLSWLTVPLLGRRNIKRFLPAAFLVVLLEGIQVQMGKKRKWWVFYNHPTSYLSGEFPFNIGPFLVGSMWILKWTYGNFKKFILINAVVDGFFSFVTVGMLKKLKVVKLVRFSSWQFFLYIFYKSFLLYGLQFVVDKMQKKT